MDTDLTEYKIGDIWETKYGSFNDEVDWNSGHRAVYKVVDIEDKLERDCGRRTHPAGKYAHCEIIEVKNLPSDLNDRKFYQVGFVFHEKVEHAKLNNRRFLYNATV